ncbi:MAG: hypothetical protein ACJAT4_002083 [Granulosicoccus sp.]|jgi:hypothetical protein
MRRISLIIVLAFFFTNVANAGGGWTQPKGGIYLKLSEWWIISNQHYTDAGLIDPNTTSGIFNTSFYGEYGITDRWTAVAYVPFFSRSYMNNVLSGTTGEVLIPGEAINSFGDTDLSIKYALNKKGLIRTAATLTLGLPLGNNSGGSQGNLQTGDGEFNQLLQLDASSSFRIKNISIYGSATVGFNNRTKGFSDEFRYGIEVGAGLFKNKFWLIGRITGVESFQNGTLSSDSNSTSIFANNSEFTSYSVEGAIYLTKQFGVSASYASAFRGQIIFANPSYSVGVFLDLTK